VDGRALNRMRLAFVGLGVALLLPLLLLVRSAAARLEEQRKLKHQVVAERIFDEMERELATLLEHEHARPSAAYAAAQTRVQNWDPFVVGYFTHDYTGPQVTARVQLTAGRAQRVADAARSAWQDGHQPVSAPSPAQDVAPMEPAPASGHVPLSAAERELLNDGMQAKSRAYVPDKRVAPKQEAVLRQLNRSGQKKEGPKRSSDSVINPSRKNGGSDEDPLQGMDL
jgi:hypothetical protein